MARALVMARCLRQKSVGDDGDPGVVGTVAARRSRSAAAAGPRRPPSSMQKGMKA